MPPRMICSATKPDLPVSQANFSEADEKRSNSPQHRAAKAGKRNDFSWDGSGSTVHAAVLLCAGACYDWSLGRHEKERKDLLFLKKRSKKTLSESGVTPVVARSATLTEVFWFFFPKKNGFLASFPANACLGTRMGKKNFSTLPRPELHHPPILSFGHADQAAPEPLSALRPGGRGSIPCRKGPGVAPGPHASLRRQRNASVTGTGRALFPAGLLRRRAPPGAGEVSP